MPHGWTLSSLFHHDFQLHSHGLKLRTWIPLYSAAWAQKGTRAHSFPLLTTLPHLLFVLLTWVSWPSVCSDHFVHCARFARFGLHEMNVLSCNRDLPLSQLVVRGYFPSALPSGSWSLWSTSLQLSLAPGGSPHSLHLEQKHHRVLWSDTGPRVPGSTSLEDSGKEVCWHSE